MSDAYAEMNRARTEYEAATSGKPARKQRGASKAQLVYRAQMLGSCVYCGLPFGMHTVQMTLDCANARS